MQLPSEDQFLLTRAELTDRLCGLLGGRAVEELVFSEVTTGAQNDLERAKALARQMVAVYGMSESVGLPAACNGNQPFYPVLTVRCSAIAARRPRERSTKR